MKKLYTVHLTMHIEAHNADDAADLALQAHEHLHDTFNDDDSISPMVSVSVDPNPQQPKE